MPYEGFQSPAGRKGGITFFAGVVVGKRQCRREEKVVKVDCGAHATPRSLALGGGDDSTEPGRAHPLDVEAAPDFFGQEKIGASRRPFGRRRNAQQA